MTDRERAVRDILETTQLLTALYPWRNAWGGGGVVNRAIKSLEARLEGACEALMASGDV